MSSWQPEFDFPAIADATAAVTFVAADDATTEIAGALRRRLTRRDVETGGGRVTQADVFWHLPQSELATAPQPGERIIDDDAQTWVIVAVDQDVLDGRWRCTCRQQALNTVLLEEIDWLQAAWTKNEHGALDAEWTEAAADLPAEIRTGEAEQVIVRGVRTLRQAFIIALASELAVGVGDRFARDSGDLLEVVGFTPIAAPGDLFVVNVVPVDS